jgi:hypothetical protein
MRASGVRSILFRLAFLAVLGVIAFFIVDNYVPSRHVPWKPVDLGQPPGLATGLQLDQLAANRDACIAALKAVGVVAVPAPDVQGAEPYCQVRYAVRIQSGTTPLSPKDMVMSCPVAAAYVVWDRQYVQPIAEGTLGSKLTGMVSYGTYSCRPKTGGRATTPSEHAVANALDIGEFRLADGRRVTVKDSWNTVGPAADFLRHVRDGGCEVFRTVLGPDYNLAHADHIHLDMGNSDFCPHQPDAEDLLPGTAPQGFQPPAPPVAVAPAASSAPVSTRPDSI